jgi:nicotinate-nucleotide adenylyltransferase
MRSGVLGGTFDPPHLAHLVLAAAARRQLGLDRVLFVPAGEPWRKTRADVTPASIRCDLVEAAIEPLEWAACSRVEVEREGPSFSADTMELLARDGGEWWFILGADALADLPNWHEPERLLRSARLAVAHRGGDRPLVDDVLLAQLPGIKSRVDAVRMPPLRVSSSELRARFQEGADPDGLVPFRVRALVAERGLYRV